MVALPISRRFLADSARPLRLRLVYSSRVLPACRGLFCKIFRRVSSVYRSVGRLITRYAFRESAFHSRPIVILTRDPSGRTLVFHVYTRARLFSDVFQRRGDVISNSRSWLICIGNYVLLQADRFDRQFFSEKFLSYRNTGMTNFHGDNACCLINLYPITRRSIFLKNFSLMRPYNSKTGISTNFYGDIQCMYGY